MILIIILQIGTNGDGSMPAKDVATIVPTQTVNLMKKIEHFCMVPPDNWINKKGNT